MNDLIVVAPATERKYLLDEYEDQLRKAGIDFHIEPVVLPDGIGSMTMRWRIDYWRRMCDKFRLYYRIVFTDAWDVLFFGSKEELCWKIPPLLISAERNCWPDESLAVSNTLRGPWKYPNPGMMCGYPDYIVRWLDHISDEETFDDRLDLMDQLWCNHCAYSTLGVIPLDSRATVFYVVSADKENMELTIRDGRPYNSRYRTFPSFFHFAGPCHPDPFRALLRGEVVSLGGVSE